MINLPRFARRRNFPRHTKSPVWLRFTCALAVALSALVCAPAAWASYAQMRLDGLAFLVAVVFLYWWCFPLAIALAMGWCRRTGVVIAATVVTAVLTTFLIAVFDDGRATLSQRPLSAWAMFVLLSLAAVPAMLAAPLPQFVFHARGIASRLPVAVLLGALVLVPAGSVIHYLLQETLQNRAFEQARELTPGGLLPHIAAARQRATRSWLSPYWWNEETELKWLIIGLGRLGFVENPAPLSADDTQALELLIKLSAGNGNALYISMLESKLAWDRLMRAAPGDRLAVVTGLTEPQASHFIHSIGMPHADWFCTPLADPETEKAIAQLWARLPPDNDRKRFAAAINEKCGKLIGAPAP